MIEMSRNVSIEMSLGHFGLTIHLTVGHLEDPRRCEYYLDMYGPPAHLGKVHVGVPVLLDESQQVGLEGV